MLTDKKYEKLEKILGVDGLRELEAKSPEELNSAVVNCEQSIKKAYDELEANEQYQEIKETLRDLKSSFGEVRRRQNAIIQYSLHLLEEKGK